MKKIVCFGDSNTWGYTPGSGERYSRWLRWTGVMAHQLGDDFEIIEEGQNGRTTVWDDPLEGEKNGLRYLKPCLESHTPLDLVILMLGTNDLKHRFSLTAVDIANGIECLLKVIIQSNCTVNGFPPAILLAVPPPVAPVDEFSEMFFGAEEKSKKLAKYYFEIAQRFHCAYLDVGQIITIDPKDGIHFSAQSHQMLGNVMADMVLSLLTEDKGTL